MLNIWRIEIYIYSLSNVDANFGGVFFCPSLAYITCCFELLLEMEIGVVDGPFG